MKKQYDNIAVIGGAGHIGLPLSLLLADKGYPIKVIDKDKSRIDQIKKGKFPFKEDGGSPLLKKVLKKNSIDFFSDFQAIETCGIVIITIGTPIDDHFNPDLSVVFKTIDEIKPF